MDQYNAMLDSVKEKMTMYVAVSHDKNPVAQRLSKLNEQQLDFVVGQYCIFPRTIVSMLGTARDSLAASMPAVSVELERNIGEETGTETDGKTHYEILTKAIDDTLGLKIKQTMPTKSTKAFVSGMRSALADGNAEYIFGAVYALETTAIPELEIVRKVVEKGASLKEKGLTEQMRDFFDTHINDFEIGHQEGLRDAGRDYIDMTKPSAKTDCIRGFEQVMKTMDEWWTSLAHEADAR